VTASGHVASPAADPPAAPHSGVQDSAGPTRAGGSIRLRVTLALVGVSVFALVAVGMLFYGFLGRYVLEQRQEQLLAHATQVADQVGGLWDQVALQPESMVRTLVFLLQVDMSVLPQSSSITILQGDSILVETGPPRATGRLARQLLPAVRELGAGGPAAATLDLGGGARLIVATAPVQLGSDQGLVLVTLPTSDAVADRGGLFRILFLSGLLAIGLAVLVGLALGRWLTGPLQRLSSSAHAMARGSYDQSIVGTYPGEVYDLADGLETMRREVKRSEDSLKGFVASAAHELRTPLTSIQGFSQALLDGTAETPEQRRRSAAAIYRESGRLRRLVDALLTLSRYDSREFHPAVTPVSATHLLSEEVERLVEAGIAPPGRIRLIIPGEVRLTTDPDMLRQVVANLLRNAVQYGGDDPIEAEVLADGASLVLTVSNGGPPLSSAEQAQVFERFFRGREGQRQEGFGLGLPLVREICEVLGGSVDLVAGPSRTVFKVTLPVDPSNAG
jgi:two-component system OmpR family sensor kinase